MKKVIVILAALTLSLALLALAIDCTALSDGLMLRLMRHYAPPESSHLPAAEYEPVVRMIVEYLEGDRPDFQHFFTVNGTEYAAFNVREQQHMQDVQGLFRLCDGQVWMLITACMVGLLTECHLFGAERLLRVFRRMLLTVLAAVAVLAVLACIDFDSLFILFHRIAFTNDLWLLDPRTDLLIRLMPIGFFISYASLIGGGWLLGMGSLLIIVSKRIRTLRTKEGE